MSEIKELIERFNFVNKVKSEDFENLDFLLLQCPGWGIQTPPLSLAVLSSYAQSLGHNTLPVDLNVEMFHKKIDEFSDVWNIEVSSWFWNSYSHVHSFIENHMEYLGSFIEIVKAAKPKCIGFSIYNSSYDFSVELAKRIKEELPETIILFGGPHVSLKVAGRWCIKSNDHIDLIVEGEGEETLKEVLAAIKSNDSFENIPGVFYKKGGEIVVNEARAPIRDLDGLPFANFHHFDFSNYTEANRLPIMSSRGCPNKCIYCTEMVYWKTYRSFSAERVFKEISYQKKQHSNLSHVDFQDSLINGNLRHLKRLATLLVYANLGVTWASQAVIRHEMDYKYFALLKKSGCVCLAFGMETTSMRLMKIIGKNLARMTDLDKFVRESSEAGLCNVYNFMFGLPKETEQDHKETLNFIRRNAKYIHTVNPSPAFCGFTSGTAGGDHPQDYDMIPDPSGNNYWTSEDGTNTFLVRLRRFEEFSTLIHELGINTTYPSPTLLNREKVIGDYHFFHKNYKEAAKYLSLWIEKNQRDEESKTKLKQCLSESSLKANQGF